MYFFCPECGNEADEGFTMAATNGALFSVFSMDAGFNDGVPMPMTVIGRYADSSTITANFNNLNNDWSNLETLVFGAAWSDLESVTVEFDNTNNMFFNVPGVDNIVATLVPIPPAVLLFGWGLGMLAAFRRKNKSRLRGLRLAEVRQYLLCK